MIHHENANPITQFRQQVYQNFNKRADTLFELVDALSSNTRAGSVVELSLNPAFRREYAALFKAVAEYQPEAAKKSLAQLAAAQLEEPERRPFWLLGVDVTPQPRPFAERLADRGYVYQPNLIRSNKPVTIGHQYSAVVCLPERVDHQTPTWVVPLSMMRVNSSQDKELVGAAQIGALLGDAKLPFQKQLCVEVADSSYSKPAYLHANRSCENLVTVTRVRSNRTFYRSPEPTQSCNAKGHPTWYGAAFKLSDAHSWHPPDESARTTFTSRSGKHYQVEIEAWHDMRMRGQRKPVPRPMHLHAFTLVHIRIFKPNGEAAFQKPIWLIVVGKRRQELSRPQLFQAYNQRYDLEHFFRFGKQRLLLGSYQTPDTRHEEHWWQLVCLAYLQLWVARQQAVSLPRPWERGLAAMQSRCLSAALVQRDFGRIIRQIGTPAQSPKRRGKSRGRRKGTVLVPRPRLSVVYKGST